MTPRSGKCWLCFGYQELLTIHTIHLVRSLLTNTVPMYSCTVVADLVGDVNDELISPASLQLRPWESAVEDLPEGLEESIGGKLQ